MRRKDRTVGPIRYGPASLQYRPLASAWADTGMGVRPFTIPGVDRRQHKMDTPSGCVYTQYMLTAIEWPGSGKREGREMTC